MKIYDLIGVGFGPSNIAVAIALQEKYENSQTHVNALFLEQQATFAWHPDMLLDNAQMQVSFLKDLVTLRNPQSKYSFVNYLHIHNRLQDFINLKTLFPSRYEFNDYLTWLANSFSDQCHYDQQVLSIKPYHNGDNVELLQVVSQDSKGKQTSYLTKSIVIGAGGYGNIPPTFATLQDDKRVFHSSNYLSSVGKQKNLDKVAVIGAGQSSAEIFLDLHNNHQTNIDLIMRSWAFQPADDSPFVNEIFNPHFTDYLYHNSPSRRQQIMTAYKTSNYSAPDLALIKQIYEIFYQQKISHNQRHNLLRRHKVVEAMAHNDGITLTVCDMDNGQQTQHKYDAVVLATGYIRNRHEQLLAPIKEYLGIQEFAVDRNYQIKHNNSNFKPLIFLQGACEASHGLSDTLLSVLAIRSAEICDHIDQTIING